MSKIERDDDTSTSLVAALSSSCAPRVLCVLSPSCSLYHYYTLYIHYYTLQLHPQLPNTTTAIVQSVCSLPARMRQCSAILRRCTLYHTRYSTLYLSLSSPPGDLLWLCAAAVQRQAARRLRAGAGGSSADKQQAIIRALRHNLCHVCCVHCRLAPAAPSALDSSSADSLVNHNLRISLNLETDSILIQH